MKRSGQFLGITILVLCTGALFAIAQETSAPISAAGVWRGELRSPRSLHATQNELCLTEKDGTESGSYDWCGFRGGQNNIDVKGVIQGNALTLDIPSIAFGKGKIEAVIEVDTMRGTYMGGSGFLNELEAKRVKRP